MGAYNVARGGILSDAYAIAKSPTEHCSARILHRVAGVEELVKLEDANLTARRLDIDRTLVNVAVRAARDEEEVGVALGDEKRAGGVSALLHARDDVPPVADCAPDGIVLPGIDV